MNLKSIRNAGAVAIALALTGCGDSISGVYEDTGGISPIDALNFVNGSEVEIQTLAGASLATYEFNGEQVSITNGGQTSIFKVDENGCLNAGGMIGPFCKKD